MRNRNERARIPASAAMAALSVLASTFAWEACSDAPTELNPAPSPVFDASAGTGADPSLACSPVASVSLVAGRSGPVVGTVRVANSGEMLFVTYETSDGWTLRETHLFAGVAVSEIPTNPAGNPVPGKFPYHATHASGVTVYTYAVPIPEPATSEPLIVSIQAKVARGDEVQGAWSEGERVSARRSPGTYLTYQPGPCGGGDTFVSVDCPDLSLSTDHALPLEQIGIGRLPASFGDVPYAYVSGDGEQDGMPAFVELGEAGAHLLVPLHPSGSPDGGQVSIRFTDGVQACPAQPFSIDPLPAAEGEFGRVVSALETIVESQAALFGIQVEDLVADPTALPDYLVPVAVTYSIVGDPSNPNSLVALADNGLDPEQRRLLDAMLGRVGLLTVLDGSVAGGLGTAAGSQALTSGSQAHTSGPQSLAEYIPCSDIQTADMLDACMRAARSAKFKEDGATGEVLHDLANAFGVVGLIPGGTTGTVSKIAGVLIWLRQTSLDGTASILPSRFVSLEFDYKSEFNEDEDGPGEWKNAMASAKSDGWNLDKTVIDAVFQFVGVRGGGFGDFLGRVGFETGALDNAIANYLLTQIVQQLINNTGGSDGIHVDPKVSGPVDVSSPSWSDQAVVAGTSIELVSHGKYDPMMPGTSLLQVRTIDPAAGEFGYQQIIADPVDVTVKAIQLTMTPATLHLKAGEPQTFSIRVANASHPERIELDAAVVLQGSVGAVSYVADGLTTVEYTAPLHPDASRPDLLTFHYVGKTGAREFVTDERSGIATIRFGEVNITPAGGCVDAGKTLTFSEEVLGLDDTSLEWSADVGSFDAPGVYRAPDPLPDTRTATIVATSVENPEVADTAFVDLGCGCSFSVAVGGSAFEGGSGDVVSFRAVYVNGYYSGELYEILLEDTETGGTVGISIAETLGLTVLEPGTYSPVRVGGALAVPPGYVVYYSDSAGPTAEVAMDLDEYRQRELLSGSAYGQVHLDNGEIGGNQTIAPFQAVFRIVVPADYVPPIAGPTGTLYACTIP